VGVRAPPRGRAWAGLEKPQGAHSVRVPPARLTAERLLPPRRRLVLGADPWRTADPALRPAPLRASCSAKSAGEQSDYLFWYVFIHAVVIISNKVIKQVLANWITV
jgi:shikimate kinase